MKKQKNMNAGLKSMKNKGIFQFQFTEIKEYTYPDRDSILYLLDL